MNCVITTERIPIKLWLDEIEEQALEQARHLANLPFAVKHIAIMPDVHVGYGMPIGGVLATDDIVIPNAVGVDIGCGMCAVRTNLHEISIDFLRAIVHDIKKVIPVGFKHHVYPVVDSWLPNPFEGVSKIVWREFESARKQVGTLGGGNHFIEIQKGSDSYIWIMIHSGSRNVGKQVADHYNRVAKALNEKWCVGIPKEWQLAFLPLSCREGQHYIDEMNWCVEFAKKSRELMMSNVLGIVAKVLHTEITTKWIDVAHNYARVEPHYGQQLVVHRKGATYAGKHEQGIIPGSQGTSSYIVEGLGNALSFESCSHGAGRTMGRKHAKEILDLETEQAKMGNIIHSMNGKNSLDEAPGAYKNIDVVMHHQRDLVKIVTELTPLAVVKG